MTVARKGTFRGDLESLLNQHSMENGSDTPDFILASYLADCLLAFDEATNRREQWYNRTKKPPTTEVAGEVEG